MRPTRPTTFFSRFSRAVSRATGRAITFSLACGVVVVWLLTGPLMDYSDRWQLIINTGTTIVTFLMVFLIQSTQNRDTEALQVKIDELLRVTQGAHVALLDLEELEPAELEEIRTSYRKLAEAGRERLDNGGVDTDVPEVEDARPPVEP